MTVILMFWLIGTVLIYFWASKWNLSGLLYVLISILVTPLFAGLILLASGHRKGIGKCPHCGEWKEISETQCSHCEHEISEDDLSLLKERDSKRSVIRKIRLVIALGLLSISINSFLNNNFFFPPLFEIEWGGARHGIRFKTLEHGRDDAGNYYVRTRITNKLPRTIMNLGVTCRLRSGFYNWSMLTDYIDVNRISPDGLQRGESVEHTFVFHVGANRYLADYIVTYDMYIP